MPKILWNDYLVAFGILMNVGAKIATGYIENSLSGLVTTTNTLEANPVQRSVTTNSVFVTFVISMVFYAGLLAYYAFTRASRNNSQYHKIAFNFFTFLVFIGFIMDFANDAGVLFALILK